MSYQFPFADKAFAKCPRCMIPQPPNSFGLEKESQDAKVRSPSSLFPFHNNLKMIFLICARISLGGYYTNPIYMYCLKNTLDEGYSSYLRNAFHGPILDSRFYLYHKPRPILDFIIYRFEMKTKI